MKTAENKAQALYKKLCGTCDRMPDWALEDHAVQIEVGHLMFNCDICNWWGDTSELVDTDTHEMMCEECFEDQEGYKPEKIY